MKQLTNRISIIKRLKMPEFTKTLEATKAKVQPWRKVWPAPDALEYCNLKNPSSGGGINGAFAYNDKDEGIAPKKEAI